MSKLLNQLSELQNALTKFGDKYQSNHTELLQLKTRPLVDVAQLDEVNHQLSLASEHNQQLQLAYDNLEQHYKTLHEAYQAKEIELSKINQQIEFLNKQYHEASDILLDLMERLKAIDNEAE